MSEIASITSDSRQFKDPQPRPACSDSARRQYEAGVQRAAPANVHGTPVFEFKLVIDARRHVVEDADERARGELQREPRGADEVSCSPRTGKIARSSPTIAPTNALTTTSNANCIQFARSPSRIPASESTTRVNAATL